MLRSKRFFGFVVLATSCGFAAHTTGCGDDDARDKGEDAGTDTSTAADTGAPDTSTADTSTADAADAAKPAPVFLDPSNYTDLFAIDAKFPYDVTQKHVASLAIASGGATQVSVKWGTTGPIVTTSPYSPPTYLHVDSWTIPSDPKAASTSTTTTAALPSSPPAAPFWSGDGFVDLPFVGPLALQAYTVSAVPPGPPRGEVLLYALTFATVTSRAFTNGFYSGVGLVDGTTDAIVYSGLSGLAAAASDTSDNGLYAAPLCNGQLVATGACALSHKLFGWTGNSGPVAADTLGNVFVAAALGANGEVYGVSKAQAFASTPATKATLATNDLLAGTSTEAAIAEPGSAGGWLLTNGYADFTTGAVPPVYGVDYTSSAAGVVKGTHDYAPVISPTAALKSLALFNDPAGNLWLAITTATDGMFLELRKKP